MEALLRVSRMFSDPAFITYVQIQTTEVCPVIGFASYAVMYKCRHANEPLHLSVPVLYVLLCLLRDAEQSWQKHRMSLRKHEKGVPALARRPLEVESTGGVPRQPLGCQGYVHTW